MSQTNLSSAKLIEKTNVSETLAVFKFLAKDQLSFKAGQYASLAVEADGDLFERPYSICSSPHEGFLEFFIELVRGGLLTPKLWELKLGSTILVRRRIVGHFTLDGNVNRHLMLATVTGVAPFVSMARTERVDRGHETVSRNEFLIIHGASRSSDFGPYLA